MLQKWRFWVGGHVTSTVLCRCIGLCQRPFSFSCQEYNKELKKCLLLYNITTFFSNCLEHQLSSSQIFSHTLPQWGRGWVYRKPLSKATNLIPFKWTYRKYSFFIAVSISLFDVVIATAAVSIAFPSPKYWTLNVIQAKKRYLQLAL